MTESRARRNPAAPPNRRGRASSAAAPSASDAPQKARSGRSSRRGRSGGGSASTQLTSLPTHRGAYQDTRAWLLERHGPVCAYCACRTDPDEITLDHVTPRRGQSAYDRRDNLVLSCRRCNANKADKPILVFLLDRRERAEKLLRYGTHLSSMLVDMAREIAGPEAAARAERLADPDYPYAD
ncbi:MAG: HNH endonuclease [Gemmatimonadaceae bacterium]